LNLINVPWTGRVFIFLPAALVATLFCWNTAFAAEEYHHVGGENSVFVKEWKQVEEYWREMEEEFGDFMPSWDFSDIWEMKEEGFIPGVKEIAAGLLKFFFGEIVGNLRLMGQLILLSVASSLLKALRGNFAGEDVSRLAEAVTFLVLLGLALSSFTIAVEIGRNAVENMVTYMLSLLPVLLTLMASMGHVTSVSLFHPLIIFSVNLMASLVRNVIFPFIFFATVLYLLDHFSPHLKINRLAGLFKEVSTWMLGLMLTLFVGLTAVKGVAGGIGDALTLKTARFMTGAFIPVVGKMLSDAVETVLGYSLLVKNSATIAGLAILAFMVVFPLIKLLSLVVIYKLAGALVQPLGEDSLGDALYTMGNCLIMIFAAVVTVGLAFFIGIAIIIGASNAAVMLR